MSEPIAVLMYHSIAPENLDWVFNYLSIDPDLFEDQISTLKRAGYVAITLDELHSYVLGKTRLPPKSIVLTFDDGYLDNWVFAFPILRKYGFKATVFVSTDFVDRRGGVRPNLDDVWQGRLKQSALTWKGFLSYDEMRRMKSTDLVDIQGHCKTHTWYFTSSKIVDFHHPGDGYVWLAWNACPERKYLYMEEDQSEFVPFGSPVYEYEKAIEARRYFPDPSIERQCVEYVRDHGDRSFFEKPNWRSVLTLIASQSRSSRSEYRVEDDAERVSRLREEIVLSKRELEEALDSNIDFLCWPGGSYDDVAVEIAREAGYRAWTLRSSEVGLRKNRPGDHPEWIRRIAAVPSWYYKGRLVCRVDGEFLKAVLDDYKELPLAGLKLKWVKATRLLGSLVT